MQLEWQAGVRAPCALCFQELNLHSAKFYWADNFTDGFKMTLNPTFLIRSAGNRPKFVTSKLLPIF